METNSKNQTRFVLRDAYLFWPRWKQFLYRVFFQAFLYLGFLFSLFLVFLGFGRYRTGGILGVFFFFFVILRKNMSDCPVNEKYLTKDKINLAVFLPPQAKDLLSETRFFSQERHLSLIASFFYLCFNEPEIIQSLSYLDYTPEHLGELREQLLQYSSSTKESVQDFFLQLTRESLAEAQELKRDSLDVYSLMLGAFHFTDPEAVKLLEELGIEKNDLAIAFAINLLAKKKNVEPIKGLTDTPQNFFRPKKVRVNRSLTSRPTPTLDKFSVDFTDLAQRLKIGVMVGHLTEYEALVKILSRPGKNNVLLLGEAGIGKETIVSYLAYNLVRGQVPPVLRDYRLIALSFSSLFQDLKTPFEACNRLDQIVKEVLANNDIILYLSDLHNYKLLTQEGGLSAFEILKPLFEGNTPLIATSTPVDFHRLLEIDSTVKNSFEIIRVQEVSEVEALKILAFQSLSWQRKTKIKISYQALKRAVLLAKRFLTDTPLPSSAESLLTEALEGARQRKQKLVTEQDIVNLVSVKTSIPLEVSQGEETERLLSLEQDIHKSFINQEEAVALVADALRQYRDGLANPNKPIGVFLFVGPTGVGKTELSKILAKVYFGSEKLMIRFDMSEYQDQRGVFRFIGDPEGQTSGVLTEAVKERPFSLILLDEFEKAHPKVLDLFLPLFDEGRLTDNLGNTIDFTNTIIIATSNALSDYIKEEIEKGTAFNTLTEQLKKKLTNYFNPELLNRFDEVVVFRPLTQEHLKEIVQLKLNSLQLTMLEKKISLEFDSSVVERLAQLGYNPIFGARPLDTVIRHFIKDELAQLILKNKVKAGDKVFCTVVNNNFQLTVTS